MLPCMSRLKATPAFFFLSPLICSPSKPLNAFVNRAWVKQLCENTETDGCPSAWYVL